jgi:hypothetical protein
MISIEAVLNSNQLKIGLRRSQLFENFAKKFGAPKTPWESRKETVFGRF